MSLLREILMLNLFYLNMQQKVDLKNATGIDSFKFPLKLNLAALKTEIDQIDVDNLKAVPVDLSKLNNVVDNNVAEKPVYDKLLAKAIKSDTSRVVL